MLIQDTSYLNEKCSSSFTNGLGNSISNTTGVSVETGNTIADVGTRSVIQSTAQSAIYGDNLGETLVDRLVVNAVYAAGAEGANQIGDWKADGTLNNVTHKIAHAGLGCAIGSISGDCASGAIGGAVGESLAEVTGNVEISKLIGGAAAIITGTDAEGIYTAYGTASNAINNNYLAPHEKAAVKGLLDEKENCTGQRCAEIDSEIGEYQKISDDRDAEFVKLSKACDAGNSAACTQFKAIHYDLRMKWTLEGNEYYKNHKGEFVELDEREKIFHTWKTDLITGGLIEGVEANNTKYIHPVYGYEVVLDENNNIVTDSLNAGTYNFYNPGVFGSDLLQGNILHIKYDVTPYNKHGNAASDPTTPEQREDRAELYIPAATRDINNKIKNITNPVVEKLKNIID